MSLKHQFDIFLEHLVANLMLLQGSFFFYECFHHIIFIIKPEIATDMSITNMFEDVFTDHNLVPFVDFLFIVSISTV